MVRILNDIRYQPIRSVSNVATIPLLPHAATGISTGKPQLPNKQKKKRTQKTYIEMSFESIELVFLDCSQTNQSLSTRWGSKYFTIDINVDMNILDRTYVAVVPVGGTCNVLDRESYTTVPIVDKGFFSSRIINFY